MASFQTIVLRVAFFVLFILLIVIGYFIYKSKNSQNWPPLVGDCPDYWVDLGQNGSKCSNVKNLGTCNGSIAQGQHLTMDFSGAPYIGAQSLCSKSKWAKGCGITWDGITSGVNDPCDVSPDVKK